MQLSRTKSITYTLPRLLFAVLGLAASAITSAGGTDTCSDCSRMAFFAEMHNLHNPDWEAQNQAWNDCMTRNLPTGYVTFENDKLTRKAEAACKKFELNSGVENRVMHESSVRTRVWMLTSPCFHLSTNPDTAAYRIESTFEAGLADAGVDDVGRAIKSVFKILLFHDETNDLIKSWETRSHNNNIGWHYNNMFNNDDAVLKADRNIEPYLREYEILPAILIAQANDV